MNDLNVFNHVFAECQAFCDLLSSCMINLNQTLEKKKELWSFVSVFSSKNTECLSSQKKNIYFNIDEISIKKMFMLKHSHQTRNLHSPKRN